MLTLQQISETHNLSLITLRRYIKSGRLRASKIGRQYLVTEKDAEDIFKKTDLLAEGKALRWRALSYPAGKGNEFFEESKKQIKQAQEIYQMLKEEELYNVAQYEWEVLSYYYLNALLDTDAKKNKWGRFGPMWSATDENGQEHHVPDPRQVDDVMLTHIEEVTKAVQNPVTMCIFYDFLFYFSKDRRRYDSGIKAIEKYIEAAEEHFKVNQYHDYADRILRGLEIALILKQKPQINRILKKIFDDIHKLNNSGETIYTHRLIQAIAFNIKESLSTSQIQQIIDESRKGADFFSSGINVSRHLQRVFLFAIRRGFELQNSQTKDSDILKVNLEVADSFLAEADEKSGSKLVQAHFLEQAFYFLQTINDPRHEQEKIKQQIEEAYTEAKAEAQPITHTFTLPDKLKTDIITSVFDDDVVKTFIRIGIMKELIPSFKSVKDIMKDTPFLTRISKSQIQDGRKINEIDNGDGNDEDNLIHSFTQSISTSTVILLKFIFDEFKARNIDAKAISEYLKTKDLFKYDNFGAVEEALIDYEEGKYYSALSILVPQVEEILRNSMRQIGKPTTTYNSDGSQRVIYIKEILENMKEVLPEETYWYFCVILYDKRGGIHLRDDIAHGLLIKSPQNEYECHLLIHLLFIIATLEYKKNNKDTSTQ